MHAGLPYKLGELFPAMGDLLHRLALNDAALTLTKQVRLWLERREQAAAMITKYTLPWLYDSRVVRL